MVGLGVNAGLGRAVNNAMFADAGKQVSGDTVGGAVTGALTPRFDSLMDYKMADSIAPIAAPQGALRGATSAAATSLASPAVPQQNFNLGNFAKDYGGAIAGGLGGVMLGDSKKEKVLYGLGGAALGDLVSGGSLLKNVIGSAVDFGKMGITKLFGF